MSSTSVFIIPPNTPIPRWTGKYDVPSVTFDVSANTQNQEIGIPLIRTNLWKISIRENEWSYGKIHKNAVPSVSKDFKAVILSARLNPTSGYGKLMTLHHHPSICKSVHEFVQVVSLTRLEPNRRERKKQNKTLVARVGRIEKEGFVLRRIDIDVGTIIAWSIIFWKWLIN